MEAFAKKMQSDYEEKTQMDMEAGEAFFNEKNSVL